MKKEVAEKWVAALRSGKYNKGSGCLQFQDEFCCLGVLCKVAEEEGAVQPKRDRDGAIDGGTLMRQQAVQTWAGVQSFNGVLPKEIERDGDRFCTLVALNDQANWTFAQIADYIEQNWEEL